MRLSDKQKAFWNEPFHRWNIKHGATRSGKTYLDFYTIPRRIRERSGKDGLIVLMGNTKGTLQRNVVEPMIELYGAGLVSPIRSDNTAEMFGEKVHCLGADSKKHVDRLRGSSIKYCYGDEVVTWNDEVFEMLKSRLDKEYSCFDGTCNPAGPGHWFKQFIDSGADIFAQQYGIDDNPFLPGVVKEALKREYTGVFYRRYILGEWIAAEGAVYPMFDRAVHVRAEIPEIRATWISVDYGHTNPTAFLRLGAGVDGRVWVLDEYYHKADETGAKSPRQYARDMIRFAAQMQREPDYVVVDPAAEGFILQLREDSCLRVRPARNDVLKGIQLVSSSLESGVLAIHPRCRNLIDELMGYAWDTAAQARGEDKPLKQRDHACDALRYGLMAYEREITRRVMSVGKRDVSSG